MQWLIHTATDNKYGVYREKRKLLWDAVENSALMDGKTKKGIFFSKTQFCTLLYIRRFSRSSQNVILDILGKNIKSNIYKQNH